MKEIKVFIYTIATWAGLILGIRCIQTTPINISQAEVLILYFIIQTNIRLFLMQEDKQ